MTFFRQLRAADGGFAYLLADRDHRQALVIDPAADQVQLCLSLLREIQVRLVAVLLTHYHGDGAPGLAALCENTGAAAAAGPEAGLPRGCRPLTEGELLSFGDEVLRVRLTPGHTPGSACFFWRDRIFTGDTLLIDDCGSTRAGEGDPAALFDSLSRCLLHLPDEFLIYPARSRDGRQVSTVGEQRCRNPLLSGISRDEFVAARQPRSPHPPFYRSNA